jgi:hypothetical protein
MPDARCRIKDAAGSKNFNQPMNLGGVVRRFFRIRILFVILFLYFSRLAISALTEANLSHNRLIPHSGIIGTIEKSSLSEVNSYIGEEAKIQFIDDSQQYISTTSLDELMQNLQIGDTVTLFTKNKLFGLASFKTNSSGNSTSNNPEPALIYHMVLQKNNQILIDFKSHQEKVQVHFYHFLLLSAVFLILFFVNRFFWRSLQAD